MSRAVTFVLGAVLGLIIGGALVLFFLSPRSGASLVGSQIQPPDAQNTGGTAVIQLQQEFFAPVLQALLRDENAPTFPLSLGGGTDQPADQITCGKITLRREGSGATTAVRMENGQILVPIAFTGNFNALGNCYEFSGWAQANLELRFDDAQKIVFGQINVQTVNLDGVPPVASGLITPLVQSTLNNRVNPVQILRGDQIVLNIPVKATNTNLQGQVNDVRAEVKENALFLYVIYNFSGNGQTVAPAQ
jgi:hypothetical protein